MFFINDEDLLMKPTVSLYNNIATSGACSGRLSAKLEVFPSPQISWEFETLGDNVCEPHENDGELIDRFEGSEIVIEHPYITNKQWGSISGQRRYGANGICPRVNFGNLGLTASSFKFYLPNARFMRENIIGQKRIEYVTEREIDHEMKETNRSSGGRFVVISLDELWELRLDTQRDALEWLDPQKRNVGTRITTIGDIYARKDTDKETSSIERASMTIEELIGKLHTLSLLLSFANGGHLGPLYIEGYVLSDPLVAAGSALVYRTTPLEQLGHTWLTLESDLPAYLQRYSTLEKLGNTQYWRDELDLILSWYFQAIQPQNIQMGKPWPVVANALGAALERLGVLVLVRELNIRGLSSTDRLQRLLETIGISPARGYHDVESVETFLDIRNDATHPDQQRNYTDRQRDQVLRQAMQWVEEVLLWRLGYDGRYRNRASQHYDSTTPRYDLATRNVSW